MFENVVHILPDRQGGVNDFVNALSDSGLALKKTGLTEENHRNFVLNGNVVLHYVGYGYASRGAPLWLLDKIRKERSLISKLVIWFHELYAFGPPWGSAFWLSPVQRYIASELMKIADVAITNRRESEKWLRDKSPAKPCYVLPVPSNVGEPSLNSLDRQKIAVVFGSAPLRLNFYRAGGKDLVIKLISDGYLVHDIGSGISDSSFSKWLDHSGVVLNGRLSAEKISNILMKARLGLLSYPLSYVAKSGVYAAYAAHGVCPVMPFLIGRSVDGVNAQHEVLDSSMVTESLNCEFSNISERVFSWYKEHRISAHIDVINNCFFKA